MLNDSKVSDTVMWSKVVGQTNLQNFSKYFAIKPNKMVHMLKNAKYQYLMLVSLVGR